MKPQHLIPAVALAAPLLLAACGGNEGEASSGKRIEADSTAVVRVLTSVVQSRVFEDWGTYSAELRGVDDAVLTAPAPSGGRVSSVKETGTNAAKGAALCDVDSELYGALLKQAEAAVELARDELERAKENVKQGFVGKAAADKAELDHQNARAALLQARRAHADSRCEAPFAGVVVSRFVERHQTVAPGAPTLRVADLSRLEALVAIPEAEASAYREGQRAEFSVVNGAGSRPVAGVVGSLDRSVESRNRVVHARAHLDNPGGALRPGMIGRVNVLRRTYDNALVLASSSVLRLQEGTAVMRVVDGRAHQVPVTLGPSRGDSVVVLDGISAGDRIISTGAFQVSEGTRVEF